MRKGSGLLGNILKSGFGFGNIGSGIVRVIAAYQDYRNEDGSLLKNATNAGIGALQIGVGAAVAKKYVESRLGKSSEVA